MYIAMRDDFFSKFNLSLYEWLDMPTSLFNDVYVEFTKYNQRILEERKKEERQYQQQNHPNYMYNQSADSTGKSNIGTLTERIERVSNSYKPDNNAGK